MKKLWKALCEQTWLTGFACGLVIGLMAAVALFTWFILPYLLDLACDC